jgi:hypothetical protein
VAVGLAKLVDSKPGNWCVDKDGVNEAYDGNVVVGGGRGWMWGAGGWGKFGKARAKRVPFEQAHVSKTAAAARGVGKNNTVATKSETTTSSQNLVGIACYQHVRTRILAAPKQELCGQALTSVARRAAIQ